MIFDVGTQSYLEPITTSENRFRVTNYNPDRLVNSHRKGVHKYCIAKDVFDVDIVISLPKIKTHQKAGLTNAMKILVGVNGDKDFLPHHRLGAKGYGGDCYPEYNLLRSCSEWCLDTAIDVLANLFIDALLVCQQPFGNYLFQLMNKIWELVGMVMILCGEWLWI